MDLSQATEISVRVGCFLLVFCTVAALEGAFPRRRRELPRRIRWVSNLGVSVLNQLVSRVLLPLSAVALAIIGSANGWGLLGAWHFVPWLELLVALLALDLVVYLQHRIYHLVPPLWRLHRMHHADTEFDVTTGVRFHPLSIVLSGLIKLGAVVVIGASPLAVLVFEVLLNATSLFNHSNLRLPVGVDRVLRHVLVTPDMHRVHHSTDGHEMNCNFGFNFPWWDRLFRTYKAQPDLGHERMVIGQTDFRDPGEQRLDRLLWQPLRRSAR